MKKRVLIVAGVAVGAALVLGATLFAGVGVVQAAARAGRSFIANRMELTLANAQAPTNEKGVVIVIVDAGSPADTAGVKRGDILLKIDTQEVNTPADLSTYLGSLKSGDKVQLSLTHGDTAKTLSVTLGDKNGKAYLGVLPFGGFFGRGGRFSGVGAPISGTHVMVTEVITGSPAETAGIKTGDIILSVDGKTFGPSDTLSSIISSHKPGDKVTLSVQHSGDASPTDVTVTLGDNPNKAGEAYLGVQYRMGGRFNMGIGRNRAMPFVNPNGTPNQQLPFGGGVTQTVNGAMVFEVTPASPASTAGLKRGDVISAIDGKSVQNAQALVDAIAAHKPGDKVTLTVQQLGSTQTSDITATLGDNPNKAGTAWLGVMLGDATMMPRGFGGFNGQGAPRFNFPGRPGNRNQTPQQGTGVGNTL